MSRESPSPDHPDPTPDETVREPDLSRSGEPSRPEEAPGMPALGDRIGPFVLQRSLGRGVSCFVWRAWDESMGVPVAVKIVNWANVRDRDAALKQMRTEAAALSRVRHPRIVRFVDFGFDARWPYLVLEFVEGRPLGQILRAGGALPVNWSLHIFNQILDGLAAVWKAGIVHRDVKPDNILVSSTGIAKLIDFGLAKMDILQAVEGVNPAELAGTAAYLAPEQARDSQGVDLRADIYSLGVTLYELLTGRLPFEGKSRMQVIMQHLTAPATPPNTLNPEIPKPVSEFCLWLMTKNPDERPGNEFDLRDGLRKIISAK